MKLNAGTYYIGDLSYVLDDDFYQSVVEFLETSDGATIIDDVPLSAFDVKTNTFESDELYNPIIVNSGIIGCIETKYLLQEDLDDVEDISNVVAFEYDFFVEKTDDVLSFDTIEFDLSEESDEDDFDYTDGDEDYNI